MKKVLLVILDGWGHSDFEGDPDPGNAVEQASVPRFRALFDERPRALVACSGEDVGLPDGQMGNSEVGHLNLGAGRIVHQDIVRVDRAAADGELEEALGLPATVERLRETGGALHLAGLVSDGGVHSHIRHLEAILERLPPDLPVRVHCITDGRDTSPTSGADHVARIAALCDAAPGWAVATVIGRYFAMDRDKRWDRTERAFRAMVLGEADAVEPDVSFMEERYAQDVTDEFIPPVVLEGAGEEGIGEDDAVLFFNFRADRMRQIVAAFSMEDFDGFDRPRGPFEHVTTLTEYEPDYPVAVAFPPREIRKVLAEVLSDAGLEQFHAAETEKYAHVTYFFNGGEEGAFPGEERSVIPSPPVATYDLEPEMSARGVTDTVLEALRGGAHAFVLVNYANPDMVGHTGSIPAAVTAVETVDGCLGELLDAVEEAGDWVALITADHGNCEKMLDGKGEPHTAHTTEPVDFIVFDPSGGTVGVREGGRLADVAPTVLDYLEVPQPKEMTGESLAVRR
jgi:2,3-bisphosphoglycerate-independent phosphoglycerate mutase